MNKNLSKLMMALSIGAILAAPTFNGVEVKAADMDSPTSVEQRVKTSKTPNAEQQDIINDYVNTKEMVEDNRARGSYRASFKRGSSLMWSRDNIEFSTSSGRVTSSSLWQECGYIFPNIVRTNGGSKYYTSSTLHKWRATKTLGAGVVTPWGDVTVYNTDYTDYYGVDGNAKAYWY